MIHLDTSTLVDAFTSPYRSGEALLAIAVQGERLGISTIVLYEWRRGPRTAEELGEQEAIMPGAMAVPFDHDAAIRAATWYREVKHPRTRAVDLAIAACAIRHKASLWTLNPEDFDDIPGLVIYKPPMSKRTRL